MFMETMDSWRAYPQQALTQEQVVKQTKEPQALKIII